MRRWIIISIIGVCVVGVCTPLLLGIYTQHKLNQIVDTVNRSSSVKVTLQHYQRHWFSSVAQLRIDITDQRLLRGYRTLFTDDNPQLLTVNLSASIAHGPVFIRRQTQRSSMYPSIGWGNVRGTVTLPNDTATRLLTSPQSQRDLAMIDVQLGFSGRSDIVIRYLPIEYTNGRVIVKANRAIGQWSLNADLSRIQGEHIGEQLAIDLGSIAITLADKTRISLDQQQSAYEFWIGALDVHLPQLTIAAANQPTIAINNIVMNHSTQITSGLLDAVTTVDMDTITDQHNAAFGPLQIQVDIKHVDATTLTQMATVSQQLNDALNVKRTSTISSPGNRMTLMQQRMHIVALQRQLWSLLPTLLSKGATFALTKCKLTTPQGVINAHAAIDFAKQTTKSPSHLIALLQQVTAQLTLAMPKSLMQTIASYIAVAQQQTAPATPPSAAVITQAQQVATTLLSQLVDEKIIVSQSDQYAFTLGYQQGQLYLNQQQTTLLALINTLTKLSASMLPESTKTTSDGSNTPSSSSSPTNTLPTQSHDKQHTRVEP